jgi:outer membrane receptor protein involved in Fe transport
MFKITQRNLAASSVFSHFGDNKYFKKKISIAILLYKYLQLNQTLMRLRLSRIALMTITCLLTITAFSQAVTVSGTVTNKTTGEGVPAVSVLIKGTNAGVYTDEKGNFKLTTSQKLPITLVFSSVGFDSQELAVSSSGQTASISLVPNFRMGEDIVVAASRVPERILESPVSIERVSSANIRNAAAPMYYDVLANIKGVDLITSSLTFKTPSTRGFNGSGNLRFNQLVDGMDNQAPGLNFSVGSIVGPTELDIDNMELLVGASSALYGSGGQNGTLLINSKSPFKYQGLSFQIKQGVSHIDNAQRRPSPYYDWAVRWGKKVGEKFAFKIGAQLVQAQDWQARDTRNLSRNNVTSSLKGGTRQTDPNYDGVNVFGDEASASMQAFAQAVRAQVGATLGANYGAFNTTLNGMIAGGLTPLQIATALGASPFAGVVQYLPFLIPTHTSTLTTAYRNTFTGATGSGLVSRTGYDERDLVDYNTYNIKLSGGLYYKLTESVEASLIANWGTGTTVYTGADRYSIKNLKMGQYKLEFKGAKWMFRAYTTQENSGDAYTATTAAVAINSAWKDNTTWFQQYSGTYGAARLGLLPTAPGTTMPDMQAHLTARTVAETGRYLPGTPQYQAAFNTAVNTPISKGGAKFDDKSDLYQLEGQYNLTSVFDNVVDVLVGATYRHFTLNSHGTIFADTAGPIGINEFGGYLQLQKKFMQDKLKLTGSARYDKNENFEGRFTPRVSAVYQVAKNNNIRASYQTAYRFPSNQDQWINLQTPASRLIGGLPEFETFFNFKNSPAYTAESIVAYRATIAAGAPNPALLIAAPFSNLKPETVQSIEVGYKGLLVKEKLLLDAYVYFSQYKDFLGRVAVGRGQSANPIAAPTELASPFTTTNYSFITNLGNTVKAFGWGIGGEYRVYKSYNVMANVYSDELKDLPAGFVSFFNTPKYRFNIGVSNPNVYKGWGFNAIYKWQDKTYWEGTFGTAQIPSYETVDVMVSYKFPKSKNMFKIGASNFFNQYYQSAFGNPSIGGIYYVSFGYNVF